MPKHDELVLMTLTEAAALVKKRKVSPVELVDACLARVEALNPKLNAFITVCAESARAEAKSAEREIARGKYNGPLHGIPVSLKDNIHTKGVRTTAGSKILADFVPQEDAFVAEALRRSGAILVGKTNLNEFAYGVTGENPHYGPVRNPWDLERMAGGSSAGSTVAVATGMCFASIGTDTGGSCRIPPALCGIVGLKPTYGRLSMRGIVPLSASLDHAGVLARCVRDAGIVLEALAGLDVTNLDDPTLLLQQPLRMPKTLSRKLEDVSLGVAEEYFFERLDDEVDECVGSAIEFLRGVVFAIEDVPLLSLCQSEEAGTAIALPEASQFHSKSRWFPARSAEYSEDVRRRLEMGLSTPAVDYLRAFEVKEDLQRDFREAFLDVDAILAPTVPIAAPRLGEKAVRIGNAEETVRSALLRLNRPANLTGHPAISIPCGFTEAGLPVGLQIIAPMFEEIELLQIAYAYEQAHDWHKRRPPA
jgi:aspartyl-tRNA(Asn)/glutamyl-tRNA(Gln) amidotransferase subunit A